MDVKKQAYPTLADVQAAGFPMGGESLAVDLADTLITVTPKPTDLLATDDAVARFWRLHDAEIPAGASAPDARATRVLRDAIRSVFDAARERRAADTTALATINAAAEAVPTSIAAVAHGAGYDPVTHEHIAEPQTRALAAAARSAIDVLTNPALRENLRRCASPVCSMLFVYGDPRRRWCTPNICGNRDRVSRHHRRRRGESA